ncbi:hypothetical protein [Prauserella muralis]|uniref:Uncharacterized protein n=1 Tax=Prauserella muralis TaxID=588067 RepID=A0A2V4AKM5_9PSEU|nr:hypothetical protein [Prauserella muralis]PXY20848.1 hypothetical protein BAY60_25425 [Prauserella muralis]TWE29885.1 hypothetical protein FHX69_2577 [Prauserella muralis]
MTRPPRICPLCSGPVAVERVHVGDLDDPYRTVPGRVHCLDRCETWSPAERAQVREQAALRRSVERLVELLEPLAVPQRIVFGPPGVT